MKKRNRETAVAPSAKKSTASAKHVPQRTCIACHKAAAKRGLVRLVLTPEGRVEVDTKGKMPGRGAYLCPAKRCWDEGLKAKKLEHALRTKLSVESLKGLFEYMTDFDDPSTEGGEH